MLPKAMSAEEFYSITNIAVEDALEILRNDESIVPYWADILNCPNTRSHVEQALCRFKEPEHVWIDSIGNHVDVSILTNQHIQNIIRFVESRYGNDFYEAIARDPHLRSVYDEGARRGLWEVRQKKAEVATQAKPEGAPLPVAMTAQEFVRVTGVYCEDAIRSIEGTSLATPRTEHWAAAVGCTPEMLLSELRILAMPEDIWIDGTSIVDLPDREIERCYQHGKKHFGANFEEAMRRSPRLNKLYHEWLQRNAVRSTEIEKEKTMIEKVRETSTDIGSCFKHGAALAVVGTANRKVTEMIVARYGEKIPELANPAAKVVLEAAIPAAIMLACDLAPAGTPIPKRDLVRRAACLGVEDAGREGTMLAILSLWDLLAPIFESYAAAGATMLGSETAGTIGADAPVDLSMARERVAEKVDDGA